MNYFKHETAIIDEGAQIGPNSSVWHWTHISANATIGSDCSIGQNVFIGNNVVIGNKVKIQNNVSIYQAVIEDGVFIGPHVCFTNDKVPRAIDIKGNIKSGGVETSDWKILPITVRYGASIGAGSILLPGVNIGKFALIGAGSVVTKDVPDYGLVVGNPSRVIGFVCRCGKRLSGNQGAGESCSSCV